MKIHLVESLPKSQFDKDFYKNHPSSSFFSEIKKANKILNDIGTGKEAGERYLMIKRKLIAYVHGNIDLAELNKNITASRDIQRLIAVLNQERNSAGQEYNDVLQNLADGDKAGDIIQIIDNWTVKNNKTNNSNNLICQKLLELYYSRYFLFEKFASYQFFRTFKRLLKTTLANYHGKNIRTNKAIETPALIEGNFKQLLQAYPKSTELEDIRQDLALQETHEIWIKIQILQLLGTVKKWQANQYDEAVKNTWKEVVIHKDTPVDNERSLIEEVARIMLEKCKVKNSISDNWLEWILQHIGDPRSFKTKNRNRWLRIGEELYRWLRAKLSQGDVKDFLENMTDGHDDNVYQYRRQFWLQYIDHVQYSKVMLSNYAYQMIKTKNRELWKRFKTNPDTYSRLSESERSCIYIDFGEFKVIEGTHNAKVRFYKDVPINLNKIKYFYSEFHSQDVNHVLIDDFTHHHSENYTWQNKVRLLMNEKLNSNIPLEKVVLEDDLKNRWQEIKDKFFAENKSIE